MVALVERYFAAVRDIHRLGAGTKERSYYPPLAELLNLPAIGGTSQRGGTGTEAKSALPLRSQQHRRSAPDFGLFAASQLQKGEPKRGQMPERGVIEMKGVAEEAWFTAASEQVSKYFGAYRLVIVTNIRAFLLVGAGPDGPATKLEGFRLTPDAESSGSSLLIRAKLPSGTAQHWGSISSEP